jgi:Suppressor of fused protein (SUFU)
MSDDTSPGGSKIYRHTDRIARIPDASDPAQLAAVIAHLTAQVGAPTATLPPAADDSAEGAPITIHVITSGATGAGDEPVLTLFTAGMSQHAMKVPPGVELPQRSELILRLPASWPLTEEALRDPRTAWPIRWLRALATLPQRYDTWLGPTHTVPNGDPPRPLGEGTSLCCLMTVPPICLADDAEVFESPRGKVLLMSVIALHEAEMRFTLERGADALIERLAAADVDDVLDVTRAPVC